MVGIKLLYDRHLIPPLPERNANILLFSFQAGHTDPTQLLQQVQAERNKQQYFILQGDRAVQQTAAVQQAAAANMAAANMAAARQMANAPASDRAKAQLVAAAVAQAAQQQQLPPPSHR